MTAQRQASRSRWENTEGLPEPPEQQGPPAPASCSGSSSAWHQASPCCWFPKLLIFGTVPLSPPPADGFQKQRPRHHWLPSRCWPKCLEVSLSLTLSFRCIPGDAELLLSGQSPSSGPCSPGTTGWVWRAGRSGQGCLLLVHTWGESGGFRALGWLLAGVETAGTVRVFTPHPGGSQTLISEHLCRPGPVFGAVRAQRQEVLAPACQELPSHRLK